MGVPGYAEQHRDSACSTLIGLRLCGCARKGTTRSSSLYQPVSLSLSSTYRGPVKNQISKNLPSSPISEASPSCHRSKRTGPTCQREDQPHGTPPRTKRTFLIHSSIVVEIQIATQNPWLEQGTEGRVEMIALCYSRDLEAPSIFETITKQGHGARYPAPKSAAGLRSLEQLTQIEQATRRARGVKDNHLIEIARIQPLFSDDQTLRFKGPKHVANHQDPGQGSVTKSLTAGGKCVPGQKNP